MIGRRIKQARQAAGMSLRGLADKAGLSAMVISKYEREEIVPSPSSVLKLARALSVRTEFFFRPAKINILEPCFRKKSSVPVKEMDQVTNIIQGELEQILELERTFGSSRINVFKIPKTKNKEIKTFDEIEEKAEELRKFWNLGIGPIENVAEMLEDHGVKVLFIEAPKGIDGFCCWAKGNWIKEQQAPVIVSSKEISGDRQRFNMLHELGHLILKLNEDLDIEKACHRFANAFLVPKEAVIKELGSKRAGLSIEELKILKRKYGMSMAAWVYRASDLGIISDKTSRELYKHFSQMGWRKNEPEPIKSESVERFKLMVFQAKTEGLISEIKAQQYLKHIKEPREVKKVDKNQFIEAAKSLAKEYTEGGKLSEFSAVFKEDFPDE